MTMMNERDRTRAQAWRNVKFWLGATVMVAGLALAAVVWRYHQDGLYDGGHAPVLIGLGLGLAVGGVLAAWKARPWDRRWQAEAEQVRRDRLQARRNSILWAFPVVSLCTLAVAFGAWEDVQSGEAGFIDYMQIGVPVVYSWVVAMVVMGWDLQSRTNRRYLDDELTGAVRARALGTAFVVLMVMGTGALGVSLWRPEWGGLALVTALTLGGAAAGLRFAWLDRQAGLPEASGG